VLTYETFTIQANLILSDELLLLLSCCCDRLPLFPLTFSTAGTETLLTDSNDEDSGPPELEVEFGEPFWRDQTPFEVAARGGVSSWFVGVRLEGELLDEEN